MQPEQPTHTPTEPATTQPAPQPSPLPTMPVDEPIASPVQDFTPGDDGKKKMMVGMVLGLLLGLLIGVGIGYLLFNSSDTTSTDPTNETANEAPSLSEETKMKARDTQRKTDLNNLHVALEVYYNENGAYPAIFDTSLFLGMDKESPIDENGNTIESSAFEGTAQPANPYASGSPTSDYYFTAYDCTGQSATDTCAKYTLYSRLEASEDEYIKHSLN